jgi:glycosyltransferase involved in cell wall biosynthesis
MKPLVSIVIPTYNRAVTITRAINSVLKQTYQNFEIIVVDDGSNDNTEEIVSYFSDNRIRYIRHTTKQGGSAARNSGIKLVEGEYIAFLDSDDEWHPEKLQKQLNLFNNNHDENLGVVYCGFQVVDEFGKVFKHIIHKHRGYITLKLIEGNCVGTLSIILAKLSYVNSINGFDENFDSCQDWDLYIRLSKICKFDFIPEVLVNYTYSKKLESIGNNKEAVKSGNDLILIKHDVDHYSNITRAKHYNWRGTVYLYAVDDTKIAISCFIKAFILTGNLKYFKGILLVFRKLILGY